METKRKSPTKITPELITNLRELVESGMKNADICEKLGIGSTTLSNYKKKYGIKCIKSTAEDKKDEIIRLYKEGNSVKSICEKLGYKSQTTIKNILNKYDIESNREKDYMELKNRIKEIAPNCLSAYEVAKKVGCAPTTARKYIKELGLTLKVKTTLTDEDVQNIFLPPLKYDFDENIINIPSKDKREYLENKIKHIIVDTREYVSILVLKNYNINSSLLNYYNIKLPEINAEFGLISKYSSALESYFAGFCDKYNIIYEAQKTFDDCIFKGKLKFDYYLPEHDILIEIQGKQHYEPNSKFGGDTQFIEQQERDKIKAEWCLEHNKKLYTICYKDLYKKNYLETLLSQVLVAKYKSGELLGTPEVDNQQPSQAQD